MKTSDEQMQPLTAGAPNAHDEMIERVLAEPLDASLPDDFATRTAAIAERRGQQRFRGASELAALMAFAATVGVFFAGLRLFLGAEPAVEMEFAELLPRSFSGEPWLLSGAVYFALVRVLAFRRRAFS